MDIILIPGLWLNGSTWDQVTPHLEEAGHRAVPITLPGMESADADRTGVSLSDCVDVIAQAIDEAAGQVLVVGHSAGAGLAHAAADARVDRVARVMHIGGFPAAAGEPLMEGFPTDGGDLPMPGWDRFDDADIRDLDDDARRRFHDRAVPSPASLATDILELGDERRYDLPATVICPEFSAEMLQEWMEQDADPLRELAAMRHVEYVDLPAGHWPQFTRPTELATLIAERAEVQEIDEHGRLHPPEKSGEVATALGFLDYQRETLEWKARGLDADGLRATTAASSLTLGGILKHMAWVEQYWFSYWMWNREPTEPWRSVDWSSDRDWEFTSADGDDPDELRRLWRTAAARSRALVAAAVADGGFDRRTDRTSSEGDWVNLRWIVLHMTEEYARHNGHADLLRESIDGATGE